MSVHERWTFSRPTVRRRTRQCVIRRDGITTVHFLDIKIGKRGHKLGHRFPSGLNFYRHRDRKLVVLNQEQHGKLEVASRVHGLPKLPFTGGAFSRTHKDDFVTLDHLVAIGNVLNPGITQPRLGTTDGVQKLRAGGTR